MVYPPDLPVQHSLDGFSALWYISCSMPTSLSISISSLFTNHGILSPLPYWEWAIIFFTLLGIILMMGVHHLQDVKCCFLGTWSQIGSLFFFQTFAPSPVINNLRIQSNAYLPILGTLWVTQLQNHISVSAFTEHPWHQLLKFMFSGKQTLKPKLANRMLWSSALGVETCERDRDLWKGAREAYLGYSLNRCLGWCSK